MLVLLVMCQLYKVPTSEPTDVQSEVIFLDTIPSSYFRHVHCVPPLEEQKLIAREIGQFMNLCDELEQRSLEMSSIAEKLARSILSESA